MLEFEAFPSSILLWWWGAHWECLETLKEIVMLNLRIDPERPIEELAGTNRRHVRWKLGNMHCMTPLSEAVRKCRPTNVSEASPALRRGLIKCVVDTLNEYRGTFLAVTGGRL